MPIFLDCKYGHMVDVDFKRVFDEDGDYHTDIGAAIDIRIYTKWLAEQSALLWQEHAANINNVLEIRAWFHETLSMSQNNDGTKPTEGHLQNATRVYLKHYADKLGLSVSED